MMGSTHRSLHIPATEPQPAPAAVPKKLGKSQKPRTIKIAHDRSVLPKVQPACSALDALRDAHREAKLISQSLRDTVSGFNRHGALIVARGAAKRFSDAIDVLLKAEEGA